MSNVSNLREVASIIKRLAEIHEMLEDGVAFSVSGLGAHATGKTGTHFLRAPDITTDIIGNWYQRALATRVGVRRELAVEALASLVAVDTKTIQNYTGGGAPSSQNAFRLIAFFGPEFASELFAHLGLTVVESDSAHAAQSLSIEKLTDLLPQLRHRLALLEHELNGEGGKP